MLATQFENFVKDQQDLGALDRLLGNGIFSVDGDMWKFHRGTARPFFTKDRITNFEIFDKHSRIALDIVQVRLNEGVAIDMQDLVSRYTMDSATRYLFSDDVQSLFAPLPYPPTLETSFNKSNTASSHPSDVFCRAFALGQELVVQRIAQGKNWPLFEFWTDSVLEQRNKLSSYIEPILERALEKKRLRVGSGEKIENKAENWNSMLEYLVERTEGFCLCFFLTTSPKYAQ
jgi:cytochrome P450